MRYVDFGHTTGDLTEYAFIHSRACACKLARSGSPQIFHPKQFQGVRAIARKIDAAMVLTRLEKLMFPGFLLVFQVVFLILFGLLVEYDDTGSSIATPSKGFVNASAGSQRNTTQVYPCKFSCKMSF